MQENLFLFGANAQKSYICRLFVNIYKNLNYYTMKKIAFYVLAMFSLFMASCSEDVDTSRRYVFKEEIISGYLSKHEQYSQYVELLKQVPVSSVSKTTVYQLLSARGNYTVFAPTCHPALLGFVGK